MKKNILNLKFVNKKIKILNLNLTKKDKISSHSSEKKSFLDYIQEISINFPNVEYIN